MAGDKTVEYMGYGRYLVDVRERYAVGIEQEGRVHVHVLTTLVGH